MRMPESPVQCSSSVRIGSEIQSATDSFCPCCWLGPCWMYREQDTRPRWVPAIYFDFGFVVVVVGAAAGAVHVVDLVLGVRPGRRLGQGRIGTHGGSERKVAVGVGSLFANPLKGVSQQLGYGSGSNHAVVREFLPFQTQKGADHGGLEVLDSASVLVLIVVVVSVGGIVGGVVIDGTVLNSTTSTTSIISIISTVAVAVAVAVAVVVIFRVVHDLDGNR
mmetsp:Transcript_19029/g.39868  ORF Transcript_19029/g.39868 Transcript_19029/m.39868 type:complete len:220 (+) Transcript_19029:453-1112(+)